MKPSRSSNGTMGVSFNPLQLLSKTQAPAAAARAARSPRPAPPDHPERAARQPCGGPCAPPAWTGISPAMAESKPGMHQLFLREDELREGLALLFQAWRDLNRAANAALAAHGLGRAHHRAIYFIGRHPGLTVGALMDLLGITKQSLHRVLGALVARGLVVQRPGPVDRRERRLELA